MHLSLDKQMPDLPTEVVFCKNCVTSNQRPRTRFNEDGICSACEYAHEKDHLIDWDARERELQELCDRHRSTDGSYDVVVPGSGGKDSAFVAHQLKARYGMHPLCVTWAPFEHTEIGWHNLQAFVRAGFPNIMAMPDGEVHRKLCALSFELIGDPFLPFIFGQKAYAYHVALQHGIKLMFYGENGEVEYGGSEKYKYVAKEGPDDWDAQYFKGTSVDELLKVGIERGVFGHDEVSPAALWWYKPPHPDLIKEANLEMHWMSYYRRWIPQENFYYASTHTGFLPNNMGRSEGTYTRHSSLDDKVDGFHYYLAYIKFGLGRTTRDCMTDIYRGHLTREEAVKLIHRFDGEFPAAHYEHFKKYLGITDEQFWNVINAYRKLSNVWEKVNGEWKLKHRVY